MGHDGIGAGIWVLVMGGFTGIWGTGRERQVKSIGGEWAAGAQNSREN